MLLAVAVSGMPASPLATAPADVEVSSPAADLPAAAVASGPEAALSAPPPLPADADFPLGAQEAEESATAAARVLPRLSADGLVVAAAAPQIAGRRSHPRYRSQAPPLA
ncbi:hypothetical protein HNR76_001807 [Pseudoxanthomonas broegbernensis]|nr:hypothetical protein [Pseudoxanthomonas broegbernensis]MBB6065249.1 hypothetical protein [Pseudoxanthomonas broegbernensis]